MVESPYLLPGDAHPHPPLAAEDLADRLGVTTAEVLAWVQEGLSCKDGLIDPFAAANWLCWGHLGRCPLLQRRWQTYMRWVYSPCEGNGYSTSLSGAPGPSTVFTTSSAESAVVYPAPYQYSYPI